MRRRSALAVVAMALLISLATMTAAYSAASIPCDSFAKNADGSWTVVHTTYIEGPNVKVQEGAVLQPGFMILGYEIAAMIANACPNATVASPAASAPQGQPKQPQNSLSQYADANGQIDVRQLSCGNLIATSLDEADLLLAWYSGWYNGQAKGHGINMARMRYAIRNVIEYCKANPDKKLTQAMESMLK